MLNGAGSENGNKINRSNSKQKDKLGRAAHVFVLFFAVVLLDYNAVLHGQRSCYTRRSATTIFSATQSCNFDATLLRHCFE